MEKLKEQNSGNNCMYSPLGINEPGTSYECMCMEYFISTTNGGTGDHDQILENE